MGKPSDLVQGTLDLLILRTLANEPMHGWAIGKRIQQVSGEVLQVQQGSLYPALHRLEQQGWIWAKWKESETGRAGKVLCPDRGRTATGWRPNRPTGAGSRRPSIWFLKARKLPGCGEAQPRAHQII